MQEKLVGGLTLLAQSSYYNSQLLELFIARLTKAPGLVRSENPFDHFCAFFVPIHIPTKAVYLGDHKKAKLWIPPGAHIEIDESPLATVKREVVEELQVTVTDQQVRLFDLSVTDCTPGVVCKTHYDFWYLLQMPEKKTFHFEKREFHNAKWVSITQAMTLVPAYYKIIFEHLASSL